MSKAALAIVPYAIGPLVNSFGGGGLVGFFFLSFSLVGPKTSVAFAMWIQQLTWSKLKDL